MEATIVQTIKSSNDNETKTKTFRNSSISFKTAPTKSPKYTHTFTLPGYSFSNLFPPSLPALSNDKPMTDAEQEYELETTAEPESEPKMAPEPEPEPETTPEPESKPETTPEPKSKPEIAALPKSDLLVTTEPEPEPESTAEPETEPEVTSEPELVTSAEPEPGGSAEPEPEAEAKSVNGHVGANVRARTDARAIEFNSIEEFNAISERDRSDLIDFNEIYKNSEESVSRTVHSLVVTVGLVIVGRMLG